MERQNGAVVGPVFGGVYGGSGSRVGGYICLLPPEYHSPVHCDSSDTGALSVGRAAAGNAGGTAVMGAVGC